MGYSIWQLVIFFIIAALIGGIIGWFIRSMLCGSCEQKLNEMKSKYFALKGRYDSLGAETSTANDKDVAALRIHVANLEESNRLQADRIADLEGGLSVSMSQPGADGELAEENRRLAARLAETDNQNKVFADELAACKARGEVLVQELESTKRAVTAATQASTSTGSAAKSSKKDVFVSDAPAPKVLMEKPEGEPDDLKKIKGVGPVMEGVLNKLGLFHFYQVAALDDSGVEWVSANIGSFPDRIKREDWVSQAAVLAKK